MSGILTVKRPSKDEYYLGIALAVSKRSTCLKRHYGAVIVKNNEIIATGYNGAPRGTESCYDCGHCKRMNVPHNTGDYSECKSVHAEQNAIISAARRDMIGSTLYLAGEEWEDGVENEDELWDPLPGWEQIQDAIPCPICSRMIKNAGIERVVNGGGDVCL